MPAPTLNCPTCGQMDMVQKVSAIYSTGISSGSFAGPSTGAALMADGTATLVGGITSLKGTSQTALSRRLAPPEQPTYRPFSWFAVCIALVSFLIAMPFAFLGIILQSGSDLFVALLFGSIGVGIIYAAYAGVNNRKASARAAMPIWNKAMERWYALYYCARDDIVFVPGEGRSGHAEGLRSLLYE